MTRRPTLTAILFGVEVFGIYWFGRTLWHIPDMALYWVICFAYLRTLIQFFAVHGTGPIRK